MKGQPWPQLWVQECWECLELGARVGLWGDAKQVEVVSLFLGSTEKLGSGVLLPAPGLELHYSIFGAGNAH